MQSNLDLESSFPGKSQEPERKAVFFMIIAREKNSQSTLEIQEIKEMNRIFSSCIRKYRRNIFIQKGTTAAGNLQRMQSVHLHFAAAVAAAGLCQSAAARLLSVAELHLKRMLKN